MLFHRVIVAIGLCLFAAGLRADGTEAPQTAVKLYRGTAIIAASDPKSAVYRPNFTPEACRILKAERWKAEAVTKTSGTVTYNCQLEERSIITFRPPPVVSPPVDCVVSAWGAWSDPPWLACAEGQQTRALVRYRTILAQPANGGAACPVLVETQTETRTCAVVSGPALKINAGGPAISDYVADRDYLNGTVSSACNRTYSGIFATRRYAPDVLRYRIPVANGQYTVRLLWRECWNSAPGLRVLSASIEGVQIAALDTYRPAGDVITEERVVTVADGAVDVTVTSVTGDAMLNGIDVVPAGTGPDPGPDPEPPPPPPATGTATLSWTAPTKNTDGSTLTNLAGYRIAYGTSAAELVYTVQVPNPGVTRYAIELAPGSYFFGVRAYRSDGAESALSGIVSKIVP